MKDLTHYFISPTKSSESTNKSSSENDVLNKIKDKELENEDVETNKDVGNTEKFLENGVEIENESSVLDSIENTLAPDQSKETIDPAPKTKPAIKKKSKKVKKRRKPSDPQVRNITELLSSSLCLVSPNQSLNDSQIDSLSEKIKQNIRKSLENKNKAETITKEEENKEKAEENEVKSKNLEQNELLKEVLEISEQNIQELEASLKLNCSELDNSLNDSVTTKAINELKEKMNENIKKQEDLKKENDSKPKRGRPKKKNIEKKGSENSLKKSEENALKEKIKQGNGKNEAKNEKDVLVEELKESSSNDSKSEEKTPQKSVNAKKTEETTSAKKNAFQFMMSSRYNSIGQNSDGKERENEEIFEEGKETREKLTARKQLLKDWADKKGAAKRKREEEEKEFYVDRMMKKRAKKLKEMVENIKKKKEENDSESDYECYSDKNKIKADKMVTEEKSLKKNNLLNFLGKNEETNAKIEVVSDDEKETSNSKIIKVKMNFTPKSKAKKSSKTSNNEESTENQSKEPKTPKKLRINDLDELNLTPRSLEKLKIRRNKEKFEIIEKNEDIKKKKHKTGNKEEIVDLQEEKRNKEKKKKAKLEKKIENIKRKKKKSDDKNNDEKDEERKSKKKKLSEDIIELEENEENATKNKKSTENIIDLEEDDKNATKKKKSTEDIIDLEKDDENSSKRKKSTGKVVDLEENEENTAKKKKFSEDLGRKEENKTKTKIVDVIDLEKIEENKSKRIKSTKDVIDLDTEEENKEEIDEDEPFTRRKSLRVRKVRELSKEEVILSSESENSNDSWKSDKKSGKKSSKKAAKVAPVFIKAAPKPKIDPEILEARRQFLMSGIPSNLKKAIEKQQSLEGKEVEVFPKIQHVQQRDNSNFWNLDSSNHQKIDLIDILPLKIDHNELKCSNLRLTEPDCAKIEPNLEKITKYQKIVEKIKQENSHYPVYKSFRQILAKSGYKKSKNIDENTPVNKNKRSKKRNSKSKRSISLEKSIEIIEPEKIDHDPTKCSVWTEKYKPTCAEDILGNPSSISALKKWLETWMNFSEEIILKKKRKRVDSTSESEFESENSRDTFQKLPGNTVILSGPSGTGKSSAVYALCRELGFNVLELNASSKRTGRKLLQELQEATQSHQVRKDAALSRFLDAKKDQKETEKMESDSKNSKMCVLLVEDVDLVFDQDSAFIESLSQLVSTSKRPIILTTTDENSVYVQKFIAQHEIIQFLPLSARTLSIWLQILCLVEGYVVENDSLGVLLEYNKGDIRKTVLQLQFWLQTGADFNKTLKLPKSPQKLSKIRLSTDTNKFEDDNSNMSYFDDHQEINHHVIHKDCIKPFEIFKKQYHIPYNINLGDLWWNIPNLLGFTDTSKSRLDRFAELKACYKSKSIAVIPNEKKNSKLEQEKLEFLEFFYDSISAMDVAHRQNGLNQNDLEPCVKNWTVYPKDSLELCENMELYKDTDFVRELSHTLLNGCIEEYRSVEEYTPSLNMAVPVAPERRWRHKHHVCEDIFQDALPTCTILNKKMAALDYYPMLRNIARSEVARATQNTKRGNRFRNYLRTLGLNHGDHTNKISCNILLFDDDN